MTQQINFTRDVGGDIENDEGTSKISGTFITLTPVLRYNFLGESRAWEVINPETVDLSILNSGNAPLLLEHDTSNPENHIGRVERAWHDAADNKCRFDAILSNDNNDESIANKITGGIRPCISCGYKIRNFEKIGVSDGIPVFMVDVQVYEISSVSIPADYESGLNRSQLTFNLTKETQMTVEAPQIDHAKRANDILQLCSSRSLSIEFASALIASGVDESTAALKVAEEVLRSHDAKVAADTEAKLAAEQAQTTIASPIFGMPAIIRSDKERSFSNVAGVRAAVTGDWSKAGYEREMSQERAMGLGKGWNPSMVILDGNSSIEGTRANAVTQSGVVGAAKEFVENKFYGDRMVDQIYNKTFAQELGITHWGGLQGNGIVPINNTVATASMVGEVITIPDATAMNSSQFTIQPREMVTKQAISRMFLTQVPRAESMMIDAAMNAIAQKTDDLILNGAGVTSLGGLLNVIPAGNTVALGTNGGNATLKMFSDLRKKLVAAKTLTRNVNLLTSGALYETLRVTLKDSANTNSGYILPEGSESVAGSKITWSQNVPSTLTKGTGTNLSMVILADWSQLVLAQWGYFALEFDNITLADSSSILLRTYSFLDTQITRPEYFAICKDVQA